MSLGDLLREKLRSVVAARARDPESRARVKADPKAALAEEGVDLPFDEARAVEDTPETMHVVLTDPNAELSDEQMETVVGGTGSPFTGPMYDIMRDPGLRNFHANLGRRT